MKLTETETRGMKAITYIPGWAEMLEQADKVSGPADAYKRVALIFRATRMRANSLVAVPKYIEDRAEKRQRWPFAQDLDRLIFITECGLLLSGGGYWLKYRNGRGRVVGLQYLNPFTVYIDYDRDEKTYIFRQEVAGKRYGPWAASEIVYFREYDPLNDIKPGVPAGLVALSGSQLSHYITRFASYFFEQGGQPITVLGIEGNISPKELKRTQTMFERMMGGIKNAWRVLAVRGEVKPAILTPELESMALEQLNSEARQQVADAFEVPLPLLENPANRSVTEELRRSFWQDIIRPRARLFRAVINGDLLAEMGLYIDFHFEEMDLFQKEEADRSMSLQALVNADMPVDIAARALGFDLTNDQWERLQKIGQAQERAFTMQSDAVLGVGSDAGAWDESAENGQASKADIEAELFAWQRFEVARAGKQKSRSFACKYTPPALQEAVRAQIRVYRDRLDGDRLENALKAVFGSTREGLNGR